MGLVGHCDICILDLEGSKDPNTAETDGPNAHAYLQDVAHGGKTILTPSKAMPQDRGINTHHDENADAKGENISDDKKIAMRARDCQNLRDHGSGSRGAV